MDRPRAADGFATIRARMEELRRERELAELAKERRPSDQFPVHANRIGHVADAIRRLRDAAM